MTILVEQFALLRVPELEAMIIRHFEGMRLVANYNPYTGSIKKLDIIKERLPYMQVPSGLKKDIPSQIPKDYVVGRLFEFRIGNQLNPNMTIALYNLEPFEIHTGIVTPYETELRATFDSGGYLGKTLTAMCQKQKMREAIRLR